MGALEARRWRGGAVRAASWRATDAKCGVDLALSEMRGGRGGRRQHLPEQLDLECEDAVVEFGVKRDRHTGNVSGSHSGDLGPYTPC